jgi:fibronectin type 3 domain-containing protein
VSSDEDGFKVERGSDGANFTQIGTTAANTTAYSDTGLTDFTKYYYRVRAANNTTGDSAYSNTANATTLIVAYVVPFLSVSSTAFGTSRVDLAWGSHDITPTECNIYRSTAAGTLGTKVATRAGNYTDYRDTGLTPGTSYYYTIELVSATWPSLKSAQKTATTLTTATFPQLITGLTYTITGGKVVLSWDPYQGAATYEVKRTPYLDRVGQVQGPLFVGNTATSMITDNTSPTDGTQYYSVRSHNAGFTQSSPWTTVVVTIPYKTMPGVERPWLDLDNSVSDRTAFQLHWYGAPGATAHHVYASTNSSMITPKEGGSSAPLDGGVTLLPIVQTGTGRYKMEIPYSVFAPGSFQWIRIEATRNYYNQHVLGGDWYYADSEEAVGLNIVAPQPAGVSGVSTAYASPTAINLSWGSTAGANSYNIYRKSGAAISASSYAKIASTPSLSYKDTGLTPESNYTYVVTAVAGGVESPASNYAVGRTLSSAVPVVSLPILSPPGKAVLWWASNNAGTTFKIYGGAALLPTDIDPNNLVSLTAFDPLSGQPLWFQGVSAPTLSYAAFVLSGGITPVSGAYWITEVYPDGTESAKKAFTAFLFI